MSPLNFARMLTSLLLDSIAASYDSDDDRILDQVERPRGHKVASLAECAVVRERLDTRRRRGTSDDPRLDAAQEDRP